MVAPVTVAVAVIVCPTVIGEPPMLAVFPENGATGVGIFMTPATRVAAPDPVVVRDCTGT